MTPAATTTAGVSLFRSQVTYGQQEEARTQEADACDAEWQEGWEAVLILPTTLYKIPGPHSGPGFTYAYAGADTQAAYDGLKAQGWCDSLPEALAPPSVEPAAPEVASPEPVADDAPVTRAELEAKANELGVKFDGRTSDAKLLAKIDAAIVALDPLREALARLDSEEN